MSDEENTVAIPEAMLSAEYKDGQLQIVEVTPYEKSDGMQQILPELDSAGISQHQPRFVQVLNADKSVMQLDLLNMTIVRCDDSSDSTTYKLIASTDSSSNSEIQSDATVTCVLQQSSDTDDPDNQDSYVVLNTDDESLVLLESDLPQAAEIQPDVKKEQTDKKLTPTEILERAKALQKAKALLVQSQMPKSNGSRGRKRKSDFPPPHELLTSPNFKLFLYNCKMCSFKCNAIKEMTAHKAEEHAGGSRSRGCGRPPVPLQCARCPYKGTTHTQLMKHVQERHRYNENEDNVVKLSGKVVEEAHVLVCGACGFESSSRQEFKKHIREEHGASTC